MNLCQRIRGACSNDYTCKVFVVEGEKRLLIALELFLTASIALAKLFVVLIAIVIYVPRWILFPIFYAVFCPVKCEKAINALTKGVYETDEEIRKSQEGRQNGQAT